MKNRVQLIGHVGQEPEIKNLESGRVANFIIATNENYTNAKGEKVGKAVTNFFKKLQLSV